ncbi:nucleolar and coiled-body phosphoprotein 1 [Cloeon dipterum]|uniref:nucleolar and coiled-body phosphoprotein 1 n=1 Tax=Cloeon dipterum TaxID=197152 RepID=UPI00321F9E39
MALNKKGDHDFSSKMLKNQEKSKTQAKTHRFQLELGESNEKTCPELNYRELVESEEKKATKKLATLKDGKESFMDIDDEERNQMEAMARKFEEKYGGSGTNKKKRKKENHNEEYRDLGAGYDDNDSFIDNTEVYDEIVPCEMTTAQGGFYINCGALEFKQVEVEEPPSDDDDQLKVKKKKNTSAAICSDSSSDDDEDDSDDDDDDDDDSDESDGKEPEKSEKPKEAPPAPPPPPIVVNGTVKAVETSVIATSKEVKSQILKRPPPDAAPNDVPPVKKPSASPEIIDLEVKEIKKPAKPQSSAISLETALKNVPELTVTMKPQQKVEVKPQPKCVIEPAKSQHREVPKEKSSSKTGGFFHQLRAAVSSAALQKDDKRLNNQMSPLEAPWNREISNLVEKNLDLLLIDGRLNKEVIDSKFLPLWPNSWMFKDSLYQNLNSILRKLRPSPSKLPPTTTILNSSQTTITPIPPKPAKVHGTEQPNSQHSSGSKPDKYSPGSRHHESREQKMAYSRAEAQHHVDDLLTQVIREHLPSPKPSSSRSSHIPLKNESRQLKLVPEEDLRGVKHSGAPAVSVDSEASVQMEMKRVMQELVELNERRNLFPTPAGELAAGGSRVPTSSASRLQFNEQLAATYHSFLPRHCEDKQAQMEELFSRMQQQQQQMPKGAGGADFRNQPPGAFLPNQFGGFQDEFHRHLTTVRSTTDPPFPHNLPTDYSKSWKF